MLKRFTLASLASMATAFSMETNFGVPADAFKSFTEICHENGYAVEHHSLVTEDGYVLTLYRIPGKLTELKGK